MLFKDPWLLLQVKNVPSLTSLYGRTRSLASHRGTRLGEKVDRVGILSAQ